MPGKEQRLLKGSRPHDHLSADTATAHAVEKRHGRPVLLTVQAEKMPADGFDLILSGNGVWLTEHVPWEYLEIE